MPRAAGARLRTSCARGFTTRGVFHRLEESFRAAREQREADARDRMAAVQRKTYASAGAAAGAGAAVERSAEQVGVLRGKERDEYARKWSRCAREFRHQAHGLLEPAAAEDLLLDYAPPEDEKREMMRTGRAAAHVHAEGRAVPLPW